MNPLTALDWQEVFLAAARAPEVIQDPGPLKFALYAMAAKAREIAERQASR